MVLPPHPPYNACTVDLLFFRKGGYALEPKISHSGHDVSGSRLLLDMKPYLDKTRFCALSDPQVWGSAVTNGIFVRFGDVELSHDEILSMAEQEH